MTEQGTGKIITEKLNVLTYVLDDDEDIRSLLSDVFRLNGFTDVVFFDSSQDLISSLKEQVHICVIDYYLPGSMTGVDVMKVVLSKNPYCKVIMISGQDSMKVVKQFTNNGGFRYVDKKEDDYTGELVSYVQEALAYVRHTIEIHQDLKELSENIKRKRVEN